MAAPALRPLVIGIDHDRTGVESDAVINKAWERELERRGHVLTDGSDPETRPDVHLHHDFKQPFSAIDFTGDCPQVAVRTWDFGPYPMEWVDAINRECTQVWLHSEWVRAHALDGGVDPSKVRVVPHGVDPDVFTPHGPELTVPTDKRFRFLFVGGAIERKGIDILLDAYCSAFGPDDDVSLIIKDHSDNAFYGEAPARERIGRLADDPGGPEIVHLDRHLPTADLAGLYRACDIGVWPYRAEGFLIPALESMACGTPTMLPEIGPTADFSDATTSFLLPVTDIRLPYRRRFRLRRLDVWVEGVSILETKPEALAERMRDAYEADPRGLADMGARGAARAHGRFTWAHATDIVERCLADIVG